MAVKLLEEGELIKIFFNTTLEVAEERCTRFPRQPWRNKLPLQVEKPQATRVVTVRPGEEFKWSLLSNGKQYRMSGGFHVDEAILDTHQHDVYVDGSGSAKIWFTIPVVRRNRLSIRNFVSVALDMAKVPLFSIVFVNAEVRQPSLQRHCSCSTSHVRIKSSAFSRLSPHSFREC